MKTKLYLSILLLILFGTGVRAQSCEGPPLLNGTFDNGIPSGWTVLDLDTNTVYWSLSARGYTGAFQPFTRIGQKCVANVAYWQVSGYNANDWLISPAVNITSAPACLSWQASSMYAWQNAYEIRISTTTPTVSAFMSNPVLFSQTSETVPWSDYSVDISSYAGQTVYIGIFYNSADQFPIYFDNIRITTPVTRDASVKTLDMDEVVNTGSHPVKGKMLNGGTSAITAMNLYWNVNNGPVNTSNLSSLNIAPGTFYNYTHGINWNPSANGTYTMKVWAGNLNGQPDMYQPNDTLTRIVFVHNYPRSVLVEEFTNTDCPPCAQQNPGFDSLLADNRPSGKVAMIKYHAPWPGPNDPMYVYNTGDIADRLFYYASPGLPNATINGSLIPNDCLLWLGAPGCLSQADIDSASSVPSVYQLQINDSISGNQMFVSVGVTALTSIPFNSMRLRIAVIEDTIIYSIAPGTNGETDFYQVMRKMLPDADGTVLPVMAVNQTLNFTYSWTVSAPAVLSQMRTVALIQDDNNLKVYQSKITGSISVGIDDDMQDNGIRIYPNPFMSHVTVKTLHHSQARIFNVLGEEIGVFALDAGRNILDLSTHPAGVYILQMMTAKGMVSKRIVKN